MNTILTILDETKMYYDAKLAAHDATPAGVDWNSRESQELRFKKLLDFYDLNQAFSINDIGCGYGALYEYLSKNIPQFQYYGMDISQAMIATARQQHEVQANCVFTSNFEELAIADYSVASGIFNVKQERTSSEWLSYILWTLDRMDKISQKGFSFNCLTSYSDAEYMRDDLYYADPCYFFDYCKKRYAKNVALLHDYGLYEFTIIVKKSG